MDFDNINSKIRTKILNEVNEEYENKIKTLNDNLSKSQSNLANLNQL
jgi:chaperonin cofactor prefoldin